MGQKNKNKQRQKELQQRRNQQFAAIQVAKAEDAEVKEEEEEELPPEDVNKCRHLKRAFPSQIRKLTNQSQHHCCMVRS